MFKINNMEPEIISTKIKYETAKYNKKEGYAINVEIDFKENGINGYINFYVDFFDNDSFSNIENKQYKENPIDLNSKLDCFEIYDTKNFIDYIESDVICKFECIHDNKINMKLYINDNNVKIEFDGILDVINR
ncbi:MAG: hypothetical protein IKG40_02410 [Bacilli bacterium]|nr:hypothetical protein [Bacilli bacterium]